MKFILLLASTLIALGNDAALNPGGHGPTTLGEFVGDESVIRMVSEKIDIRFSKTESEVHCRFVFRSGKTTGDAIQLVGFPDILEHEDYAGVIRKLETFVDGRKVESRKERGWFAVEPFGTPKCGLGKPPPETRPEHVQLADFHVITVTFPPDKDVIIERHYLANNGGDVFGTIWFDYSTDTGAVWRGTIGQADFHVKLDGLTVDDLAFEDGPQKNPPRSQWGWCAPNRAEWKIVSPTELTMTWKDFEPAAHQTRRGIALRTWSKGLPDMKPNPESKP